MRWYPRSSPPIELLPKNEGKKKRCTETWNTFHLQSPVRDAHPLIHYCSSLSHTLSIFRMFESSKGMEAQTMMKRTQPIDQTSYIFGL